MHDAHRDDIRNETSGAAILAARQAAYEELTSIVQKATPWPLDFLVSISGLPDDVKADLHAKLAARQARA